MSKFVEKVVAKQITTHVDENALRDPFQPAYRRGHSTETALLRVKNDIATALDRKYTTILLTLDLSCAFDTVDHELLMTRLEHSFGITDKALARLQSCISERYQKVAVGSAESVDSILMCGVPQGSVLGPTLYCMHIKPIGDVVARRGMQYHCYSDDTQIYLTVEREESIEAALMKVELCVAEEAAWLIKDLLLLNREKSEAIVFFPAAKFLFTYCALNGLAPDYLAELISYRPINRTLPSASLPALLFVPTDCHTW